MADEATKAERVDTALDEGEPGVTQVTVDDTTVRFDREQALRERDYWRRRAAHRRRPRVSSIDLRNA